MRAKDFLTELWTQPYNLTQKKWGGQIEYLFSTSDGRDGSIKIDDAQIGEHSAVVIHFYIDGQHGTSGRGDAIAIFSTVVAACRDWFSRHSPDFVIFESDDQKKLQVYARMAATLLKNYQLFPNWASSEYSDDIWDQCGEGVEEDLLVYVKRNIKLSEGIDIGKEWMSDTELDQYVPRNLQQKWRELLGYDRYGRPSEMWVAHTDNYEPDSRIPEHRRAMVELANWWFYLKQIPNFTFFDVRDANDDELEWLVRVGPPGWLPPHKRNVNEFVDTRGDDRDGPNFIPWLDFVNGVASLLADNFELKLSSVPKQVKATFVPHDPNKFGPSFIYAYDDPRLSRDQQKRGVGVHGMMNVGTYYKYSNSDKIVANYRSQPLDGDKWINFTLGNIPRVAALIAKNTEGKIRHHQVNEFLDDRRGDDGEGISKIVSTADRLLKQGYRVDLHVVGAMGRVYRADLEQTGFTPNGALAFKRKTRTFIRPFAIDDDDLYEFELVAPKHYKIVDSFTQADNLNESTFTEHEKQLRHFVKWCKEKLNITKPLPKMIFADKKEGPDQHRTGYYDDDTNTMWVYTGNRNLIDIMCTVCYELVHRKQHEHREAKPGESYPFAPIEQEADAVAGGMIKLYVKKYPMSIE